MKQSLRVTEVRHTAEILTVYAVCSGKKFEFVRWCGGRVEVYDYPRSWEGLARFVGYLENNVAAKLRSVVVEQMRARGVVDPLHRVGKPEGWFPVYSDRTWVRSASCIASDIESDP